MNPVAFFDTIIVLGITCSFFGAGYHAYHYRQKTKKRYSSRFAAIIFLISGLVLLYGSFIEPQMIAVHEYEYSFPEYKALGEPKTIVFFADTHAGPYKQHDFSERVVKKIKAINPDAVLIGGDYFFHHTAKRAAQHLEPYSELPTLYPTVAVLGNHAFKMAWRGAEPDYDEAQAVRETLHNLNILELEDAVTTLFDDPIHLVGAQDLWSGVNDFEGIDLPSRSERTILLSHNPDIVYDAKGDVDLILSGHTHGGQIRLPIVGPLASPGYTPLPRKYFLGESKWDDTTLFVTAGIGESGTRARLFNPPELVVITLR